MSADDELVSKAMTQSGSGFDDNDRCSTASDGDATLTSSPRNSASSSFISESPTNETDSKQQDDACKEKQPITVLVDRVDPDEEEGSLRANNRSANTSVSTSSSSTSLSVQSSPPPSPPPPQRSEAQTNPFASTLAVNAASAGGSRLISACSSHSNSANSLDSFVVVHTELVHPNLAFNELDEQSVDDQGAIDIDFNVNRHSSTFLDDKSCSEATVTGDELAENSRRSPRSDVRSDADMNRMLLAAYTKLTNTMASSSRSSKQRTASGSVDTQLTNSSSSIDSTVAGGASADAEVVDDLGRSRSGEATMTSSFAPLEEDSTANVNVPRVSLVRAPLRGATRRNLPESDLDSLDEMEARAGALQATLEARRTAHPHYRHRPNRRVDWALNELVRIAIVLVLGVLIGKFGISTPSSSSVSEAFERSASSHLEQLKAMHDELVTCLKRSGQLELALHDARSTMVQREYVEKWESLYDEARERNEALEQSYETYKRRYLLAAASQRSLRQDLRETRLELARAQLRIAHLTHLCNTTNASESTSSQAARSLEEPAVLEEDGDYPDEPAEEDYAEEYSIWPDSMTMDGFVWPFSDTTPIESQPVEETSTASDTPNSVPVQRNASEPMEDVKAGETIVLADEFCARMAEHREAERLKKQREDEQANSWFVKRLRRAANLNQAGSVDQAADFQDLRKPPAVTTFAREGQQPEAEAEVETETETDEDDEDLESEPYDAAKQRRKAEKLREKQRKKTAFHSRKFGFPRGRRVPVNSDGHSWIHKCTHCRSPPHQRERLETARRWKWTPH